MNNKKMIRSRQIYRMLIYIFLIPVILFAQKEVKNYDDANQFQTVRIIEFSGYKWAVRGTGYGGPGPNFWSDSQESVWLDESGRLHLRIRKIDGRWYCAEVYTSQYTDYGEHRFLIEFDLDNLDQNVVVGLFVYEDDAKEIDIEFSKWGDPNFTDIGSFTVQPWTIPGNTERFPVLTDSLRTTNLFIWKENYVNFYSIIGHHEGLLPSPENYIHQWIYWGNSIPKNSDDLRTHINFWLVQGKSPVDTTNLEIVITKVQLPIETGVKKDRETIPTKISHFNFPNPSSERTTIQFKLSMPDYVKIDIYNLLGEKVLAVTNRYFSTLENQISFDTKNLPVGIYFYRIQGTTFSEVKKFVIAR